MEHRRVLPKWRAGVLGGPALVPIDAPAAASCRGRRASRARAAIRRAPPSLAPASDGLCAQEEVRTCCLNLVLYSCVWEERLNKYNIIILL